MQNITGNLASGSDFFDRVAEMDRFWEKLKTDNLLLLAPRRVGKSSLMKQMEHDAQDHGFRPIFVDVSDCADELHFIGRLYTTILNADTLGKYRQSLEDSALGKVWGRVQKVGAVGVSIELKTAAAPDWQTLGEELTRIIAKHDDRWLLQIDELPVFVLKILDEGSAAGRARVRQFLYWMRRIRQEVTNVRWMLAGSIGLDTVAARINVADAINDLHIEKLGPFSVSTASNLLIELSKAYTKGFKQPVIAHIIARVGEKWLVPYYLQLVFHELRQLPEPVGTTEVDQAIECLLGPSRRNYFDYWRERLIEQLGTTDARHAFALLNECCYSAQGSSRRALVARFMVVIPDASLREDKLRYLLDLLQNDGYLVEHDGGEWTFISPLLREFWRRRVAPPLEAR